MITARQPQYIVCSYQDGYYMLWFVDEWYDPERAVVKKNWAIFYSLKNQYKDIYE